MKITKINIPKVHQDNGIEDIKMSRLGQMVLIAGKNGSGKTRLLNKISSVLSHPQEETPSQETLENTRKAIEQEIINIRNVLHTSSTVKDSVIESVTPNIHELRQMQMIQQTSQSRLEVLLGQLELTNERLDNLYLLTDEIVSNYPVVNFVPKNSSMHDPNDFSRNELVQRAAMANSIGVAQMPVAAFAKIQEIQNRWYSATHPNSVISEAERVEITEEYERLKDLVNKFLGTTIERSPNDDATLFGFPLGQTNLSAGQNILLQFCVAIHSQKAVLENLILFMDEPENHLHPSVVIETIDRISEYLTNGQIWITTHSIPLLSHFDSNSIWYMENGRIQHAGNIPEKVLESLLGDEEEIAKLQDFIGLPAQLAINRFAYQCLLSPDVVITVKDDPQILQIRSQLREVQKEGKIKVLDYGAGKGRLLANIVENLGDNLQSFTNRYDYVAFDKYANDKKDCEKLLAEIYGTEADRYFNDFGTLLSKHDKESFDIVIMSNVLHEIEPKDWLNLFSAGKGITHLLAEKGVLFLVEDMQMPVGEKAYQNGFIVFDTPQLKELFDMKQNEFTFAEDKNGRLKCHVIPKDCLSRISADSKKSALKSLQTIAKEKIVNVRNADRNYRNGKIHAYWVQQFANTSLTLSEDTND